MKISHLNCGCMCPWISAVPPKILPKEFCCHCLLIETKGKLILLDTGVGTKDCDSPKRLGPTRHLFNFQFKKEQTALEQIKKLGYLPEEVTDIILTHLDSDHASGICDFPKAKVHVSKLEMAVAKKQEFHHRLRYRKHYLNDSINWNLLDLSKGENWYNFQKVQKLKEIPELLIIPLPGHTPGHFGVAMKTKNKWLLHAGDAYYDQKIISHGKNSFKFLSLFEKVAHIDYKQAQKTLIKLQGLPQEVEVICSHDASFFQKGI